MTVVPHSPKVDELIRRLDEAVLENDDAVRCQNVKRVLMDLIGKEQILDASFLQPSPDTYARRLLHRDPQGRYTALVMVWDKGQGTPLHDHAGMWCVEGVLSGDIDVTQYELLEEQGDRYRFRRQNTVSAGVGNAGALIPPFEYHTIANTSPTSKAVTVHVYAGEMTSCTAFIPVSAATGADDGWHERQERQLTYSE